MVYPVHNSLNWTPWFEHLAYLLEEKRRWSWVIHISIRMVVNRRSLDSSLFFFINSVDLLAISLIRRAIEAKGVPTWALTTLSFQNLKMKLWIVTCDDSCSSWAFNITGQENSPDIGWPSHTSPYPPPFVPKHWLTITQHGCWVKHVAFFHGKKKWVYKHGFKFNCFLTRLQHLSFNKKCSLVQEISWLAFESSNDSSLSRLGHFPIRIL